jgi:hypothetical protein
LTESHFGRDAGESLTYRVDDLKCADVARGDAAIERELFRRAIEGTPKLEKLVRNAGASAIACRGAPHCY